MNTEKTTTKSETIPDELTVYKKKYRALWFGAIAMINFVIAILIYQLNIHFNVIDLPFKAIIDGKSIDNAGVISLITFAISIIFAFFGLIYSLMNKKIIAFTLALIVPAIVGLSIKTNPQSPFNKLTKIQVLSKSVATKTLPAPTPLSTTAKDSITTTETQSEPTPAVKIQKTKEEDMTPVSEETDISKKDKGYNPSIKIEVSEANSSL